MSWASDLTDNLLLAADFIGHRTAHQGTLFEKRKARTLARQSCFKPEAHPREFPILDGSVTPESFRSATQNYRNPVVVRGVLNGSGAVERWNAEYLGEMCGDDKYRMVSNGDTDDIVGGDVQFTEGTVRDLTGALSTGIDHRYLAGVSQIFIDHTELLDDLELERLYALLGEAALRKRFDAMNMFIGGPRTRSRMHCAFAGNFFVNIVGRKRWKLLPPHYRHLMLPVPARPFIYSMTYFDPLDADPARSTFAQHLPYYDVVLEPGDVLYNGPWWWHQVENIDRLNVGCAIRLGQWAADYRNNATFTMLSVQPQLYALKVVYLLERLMKRHEKDFRTYLLEFLSKQQLRRTQKFQEH
jgi:hypothetical protein